MKNSYLLSAFIIVHTSILLFFTSELSISYYEADIFYNKENFLHYLVNFSTAVLGKNDLALRLPMILMHGIGALLYYDVSKSLFKKPSDQLWSLLVYLLLPGVNSAAIMVDGAGLLLFLLLLFLYAHKHSRFLSYFLLPLYVFIDNSFAFLYLGIIFYSMEKKNTTMLFCSIILFGMSMYLFGIEIGGHPHNHFLDTLGIYAAIFSPIVFIYLIYALYRTSIKEERDLLWYLGSTAFIFSLLFSFRQQMKLEELAPYILLTTPIMVKTFISSYRVRLREYRRKYRLFLTIGMSFLLLSTVTIYMNKFLYLVISKPMKHFVYNNHVAKELAQHLKEMGIKGVASQDARLQLRLKFYGIEQDRNVRIYKYKPLAEAQNVTIRYNNVDVAEYYVTNLYKK